MGAPLTQQATTENQRIDIAVTGERSFEQGALIVHRQGKKQRIERSFHGNRKRKTRKGVMAGP
jgi:hypothetical protein